jgi:hypothetical protein
MKLINHSDERLELTVRPWLISLIAVGFGLALSAIGISSVIDLQFGGLILVLLSAAIFCTIGVAGHPAGRVIATMACHHHLVRREAMLLQQ